MSAARSESERVCVFRRYTPAWEVGTGLPVSLAPGRYRVTGEEYRNGICYLELNETYRVDARDLVD